MNGVEILKDTIYLAVYVYGDSVLDVQAFASKWRCEDFIKIRDEPYVIKEVQLDNRPAARAILRRINE